MTIKSYIFSKVLLLFLIGCSTTSKVSEKTPSLEENIVYFSDAPTTEICEPVIRIDAKYPVRAYQNKEEAHVVLQFKINQQMFAESITVINSTVDPEFRFQAIEAVKKWMFNKVDVGKTCKTVVQFNLTSEN